MKRNLLKALFAIILFVMPTINFAQAPNLGTAVNFVLFSTDGAVSNTGISHFTGNIGTNNGSSTAFGNVDGTMHDADASSAKCAEDVLFAFQDISGKTPGYFISSLIGNGDTLLAGVYSISEASVLSNNLYLDAQGDENAIFIFQINGSFSTNAHSKVKLLNKALACNVFWTIKGLVDMSTGTSMKGTIIVNNAAILMNSNDTLEGRVLTTAGAITVDGVLAYKPIGCGSVVLTGPKSPTLASTECYVLFSSTGNVTNTGVSTILGDVGTNAGLTVDFNPLLVTGKIHEIPDASTELCANDLIPVYTYLDTLSYDIKLLYPAQFGGNLTLTPHTYLLNAATVLTDTLYLDAQGNENAVFIIQIVGALSTSTYAKVLLINGAKAKNVFWKVGGAVEINEYSIFNGTIIASGAISLKSAVTLNGRALTLSGIFTTAAITATNPINCLLSGNDLIDLENRISIYPNPFTTSINVVTNSENSNLELKIYNVLGTEVLNRKITNEETSINVNNLSSGIYIFNLIENNKTIQTGKIISQQ